ncbi:hypothetical protein MN608_02923 [Microdochium nivale]|nr:hypothetical protein MN608_02923 [Microdochium nivale]
MDKLRSLIPEQWWRQLSLTHSETQEAAPTDTLSSPLGQPFRQSAILFYYHYVNHLVHLPYVVSGREDNRHLYSRSVALESAEGMLLAFMRLPTCNGLPVVCDWLDFATFSGAMVLVVDLLEDEKKQQRQHTESQQTQTQRSISGEGERLWALVAGCAQTMRRKADLLGCVVSSQSADLLEHLHAARHGVYVGPEEYEVVIPFFGRVRIRHPRKTQHCQQQQQQQQQGCTMLAQTGYEIFADHETAVEFNWNVSRAQQSAWGDSTMELGEDWAAQIFLPSENDWNATFTLGLAGGYGPESQFLH